MGEGMTGLKERVSHLEKSNHEETDKQNNLRVKLEEREQEIQQLEDEIGKYKEKMQK